MRGLHFFNPYRCLLLLSTCFSISLQGQELSFAIQGKIVEAGSQQAIVGAHIYDLKHPNIGNYSDEQGNFTLVLQHWPTVLRISSIGHHEQTLLIRDQSQRFFSLQMRPKTMELPEISISATPKIDTFLTAPYSVVDYAFAQNLIFILAYKDSYEKYSLLLCNEEGRQLDTLSLRTYDPVRLFKNCLGELHLITEHKVYDLYSDHHRLRLKNEIWAVNFKELAQSCVLATDNFMYFSQYYYQGQALQYYTRSLDTLEQSYRIPLIEDNRNICLLIEEVGLRLPRSGDVWQVKVSDELAELRTAHYQAKGMMKVFYPKIYAPIFGRDSTIFIFNHPESALQYFEEKGDTLFQVPIDYHHSRKWKKRIWVDEVSGKAYTSFHKKWGEEIHQIHLEDGQLGPGIPLKRAFVKQQKVRNGYLYFLYHNPYNGDRNRQLHKIRIE
ncbi:MAG: carboxypeptidase-like regulatory domain-containing protein [Bacteroidota bacterium]